MGTNKNSFKKTKPGTKPQPSKKLPTPGSGRNVPAKGYNPETKEWER